MWLVIIYVFGEFVLEIFKDIFVFNCWFKCFWIWCVVIKLFLWLVNGELLILNVILRVGLLICRIGNVFWWLCGVIVLLILMFFIFEIVIKFLVCVFLIFKCFNLK